MRRNFVLSIHLAVKDGFDPLTSLLEVLVSSYMQYVHYGVQMKGPQMAKDIIHHIGYILELKQINYDFAAQTQLTLAEGNQLHFGYYPCSKLLPPLPLRQKLFE